MKATKDNDNPGNQDNHSSKRITVSKKSTVTIENIATMDTKALKNYNNHGNVTKIASLRSVLLEPKLECVHKFQ
jgi:hypothetical protein